MKLGKYEKSKMPRDESNQSEVGKKTHAMLTISKREHRLLQKKNKSNSCRQRRLQIKVMHTLLRKIIHMEECIPAIQQYIEK